MPRRDYYAVLGVKRNATADEIKRAFRNLAMEHHPDRNPNVVDADDRFREIVEAYQTLSDRDKRSRYDRLGPLYRPDGRPPSTDDLNNFVTEALTGLFRRKRPADKGEDLRYTLSVSLEEVATGAERTIEVTRQDRCRRCEGSGASPDGGRQTCTSCEGTGRSPTRRFLRTDCPRCDGRGYLVVKRCDRCHGAGRTENAERLKVHVPAGVATGQKLKLRGKGNSAREGGSAGDLLVIVAVDEHDLFRRRGPDLFCEVPVLLSEAALGADLTVPTIDGTTIIRVPAGTESGAVFRLAGRGLRPVDGKRRGDLHIKVVVEVPSGMNPDQQSALRSMATAVGLDAHPRRRAYEAALQTRTT